MDRKQTSFSQVDDVRMFQAQISKFLTDSARYLELNMDSVTVETVLRPSNGKVIRNYQEVCYATND
jgi:hypothetical protein